MKRGRSRKIVLLFEGETERAALPNFLRKWLGSALTGMRPSLKPIAFRGKDVYLKDLPRVVEKSLSDPEVVGVIGVLDLYGLSPDPMDMRGCGSIAERVKKAREHVNALVPPSARGRFSQHFAVHETEAWLLSCPEIFPRQVQPKLPKGEPESVNMDRPPSKRLSEAYRLGFGNKRYGKTTDGRMLFQKLDPRRAAEACPNLRLLLDALLRMAGES